MLTVTWWYYLIQMYKGEIEARHGPFKSEEDALQWLQHEKLEGHFDFVKTVSLYQE